MLAGNSRPLSHVNHNARAVMELGPEKPDHGSLGASPPFRMNDMGRIEIGEQRGDGVVQGGDSDEQPGNHKWVRSSLEHDQGWWVLASTA